MLFKNSFFLPLRCTPPSSQCITSQSELGRTSMMSGFWSHHWRRRYSQAKLFYSGENPDNAVTVFSGLLTLIWKHQLTLWANHLEVVHKSASVSILPHQSARAQYESRIRHLHTTRDRCLHSHREQYFYQDVEGFLQEATVTQLKNYLHSYEPAIQKSIQAAKYQPLRTSFTSPGFSRTRVTAPFIRPTTQLPPETPTGANRGSLSHRKHTRWRVPHSIQAFFLPKSG